MRLPPFTAFYLYERAVGLFTSNVLNLDLTARVYHKDLAFRDTYAAVRDHVCVAISKACIERAGPASD